MSLKALHIVFITLSMVLAVGFGVWEIRFHLHENNYFHLTLGVLSLLFGVALVPYGIWFLRKLKHVGFM